MQDDRYADPSLQPELAVYINKHYNPLLIAESIARHEYFKSEPLIAVAHGDRFVVIEGNRRLAALMGLADKDLRGRFAKENSGWSRLPAFNLPETFPVVVVANATSVAPLLGFRHISGIEPWAPYAQARYIARLVDDESKDLDEVAELVGRTRSEVRAMYRDYDILEQAEDWGLDTRRARAAFGVFSNAMGRRAVQAYVGATAPRFVNPASYPLPDGKRDALADVLRWAFGDYRGSEGRVIFDSRQLGDLAKVLSSDRAIAVLRETGDLTDALDALTDTRQQFSRAASAALRELRRMHALPLADIADQELRSRFSEVVEEATEIAELLRDPQP